ncbi:MAG: Proline dehydrogenase, partial [uncultured Chloroflexia bacterium]
LQGLPHRQAELHTPLGRALEGRGVRGHSDARRVPDLARFEAHPPAGGTQRPLRVPDAARGRRGAEGHPRRGRARDQGLRAFRGGLVRVLDPPSQGEPEDSRLRRYGRSQRLDHSGQKTAGVL